MTGIEVLVAGYLARWAKARAQSVGDRLDAAVDAALGKLADRVLARVGGDPAVQQLQEEAQRGGVAGTTRLDVQTTVADALRRDPGFAAEVARLVDEVQRHLPTSAPPSASFHITGGDNSQIFAAGRDQNINISHGRADW